MSKVVFKKDYDGESLYDVERDVMESFDENYNPIVKDIPQDQYGIQKGTFTVTITWNPEE